MEQILGVLLIVMLINVLTVLPVVILWTLLKRATSWLISRRWAPAPARQSLRLEPLFSPRQDYSQNSSATSAQLRPSLRG
jgi:hypothetical protein